MFRHEFMLIRKNKKTKIIISFLLLLVIADLILAWYQNIGIQYPVKVTDPDNIIHPAFASFLSASTEGHITQMLYLWLLPIHLLLIYCDLPVSERQSGYTSLLYTKLEKRNCLKIRLIFSFLFSFFIVFVTLVINYIGCILIFWTGTDFRGGRLDDYPDHLVYTFSMKHPYSAYFLYIVMTAFIAGGCGMICMGLSFVIKQYKFLYLFGFLLWYLQITGPCSLTYVFQPFIEYDLNYMIPAFLIFFVFWWGITLFGYYYRVKKDEI